MKKFTVLYERTVKNIKIFMLLDKNLLKFRQKFNLNKNYPNNIDKLIKIYQARLLIIKINFINTIYIRQII